MKLLMLVSQLDLFLLDWFTNKREHFSLARLARVISHTGDGYVQVFFITWALFSSDPVISAFGPILAIAFIFERLVYWLAKNTLKRPRPAVSLPTFYALIKASDEFSFPSGHTSASILFACFVVTLWPGPGFLALIWAALVGVSRVVLGVHYPSDILAGALLGACVSSLFI